MIFKKCLYLLIAFIVMGCASAYRPMIAKHPSYVFSSENNGLILEYRYSELKSAGNKKYARKAKDKGIQFVAAAFTNETDKVIHFGEDLEIYSGDRVITPLQPAEVKKEVRQISGLYMLWSLFWISIPKCDEYDNCDLIPLPIGVVIGLSNMGTASKANKNFVSDMQHLSLMKQTIEPGETAYGIIPIRAVGGEELGLRWK